VRFPPIPIANAVAVSGLARLVVFPHPEARQFAEALHPL
jgi:hypothetical protein